MSTRLMTFNIAHGRGLGLYQGFTSEWKLRRNLTAIADLMRDWDVDIAAFQEVDEDSHWHHGVRMMEELGVLSGFENRMMGVNTRREGEKPLAYGNALFSRYPVELWDNQPFGNATLGEKGFMYAEVVVGEHLLLPIINLHLDYRSKKRRVEQIERMIDYMCARPRRPDRTHLPPILCGDFNSRAGESGDAVAHLFEYMTSQEHYMLYPENARTFPSIWPRRGIDFLFIPGDFRVLRCQIVPALLSDHMPVFIEFEMSAL